MRLERAKWGLKKVVQEVEEDLRSDGETSLDGADGNAPEAFYHLVEAAKLGRQWADHAQVLVVASNRRHIVGKAVRRLDFALND